MNWMHFRIKRAGQVLFLQFTSNYASMHACSSRGSRVIFNSNNPGSRMICEVWNITRPGEYFALTLHRKIIRLKLNCRDTRSRFETKPGIYVRLECFVCFGEVFRHVLGCRHIPAFLCSPWPPSDAHPPDPAFAAELRSFHGVLGAAGVTEPALRSAVANFRSAVDIIPRNKNKKSNNK